FPLSGTSLASLESLSLPLVQEVVLSADMQCESCQKRVSDIITKMNERKKILSLNPNSQYPLLCLLCKKRLERNKAVVLTVFVATL
ncbi:hypothetical protein L195_g054504, partial [Trifolium pratense]